MARDPLKNDDGQTVVEYILLIAVMATIISSLLVTIKTRYLGDPTKCDKPQFSQTMLCKINSILQPQGSEKKFQFYPFKR